MAAKIVDFIRNLIRDAETDITLREVTDKEIEDALRSSLIIVDKAKLLAKYSHERKVFYSEMLHQYFVDGIPEIIDANNTTIKTYATVVFLRDTNTGDYNIVSSSSYTVDVLTGEIYFSIERTKSDADNLYATYGYCNPFDVAASMLENIANEFARFAISAQLSSLSMNYTSISEVLKKAAEHTRARGGLIIGQLDREDRVGG